MGWANVPADQMWVIVRPHIDPYSRPDVAKKIIEALPLDDNIQVALVPFTESLYTIIAARQILNLGMELRKNKRDLFPRIH